MCCVCFRSLCVMLLVPALPPRGRNCIFWQLVKLDEVKHLLNAAPSIFNGEERSIIDFSDITS